MKYFSAMIAALALLGAATAARADFSKESTPPASPPAATLDAAKKLTDAGDYRGALPMLTELTQKEPNNADALNLMGYSLRKTGQTSLALQYYNRALLVTPKHLGANEYLGELYVELGQVDRAKERLAVLHAACGDCQQAKDLSAFIDKGAGAKPAAWH